MKRAGALLAKSFVSIFDLIKPGVQTRELDHIVESVILEHGAKPAFKGYGGGGGRAFPATTCISIDEEIVHGIPSSRTLTAGQLVGIDAGLKLDGWFADMACSFLIGKVDDNKKKLWQVTREALYSGIEQARPGNDLNDVGGAIQDYAEAQGFSIIRELVGHGIGRQLHEEPQVPNYRVNQRSEKLLAGMTIAIEPMISVGSWRIKVLKDGWTAITSDQSPAGHFEHTVLITDHGPEILTLLEDGSDPWMIAADKYDAMSNTE